MNEFPIDHEFQCEVTYAFVWPNSYKKSSHFSTICVKLCMRAKFPENEFVSLSEQIQFGEI